MNEDHHYNKYLNVLKSLIVMSFGCLLFAVGFNLFILPLHFITGGVTGISVIIYEVFHIAPAYTQWALNLPLFFIGWIVIGNEYAVKIIYGSFFLPLMIKLTEFLNDIELNLPIFVYVLLGGTFLGIGLGLILVVNGSTGGVDIPARIITKFTKISIGKSVGIVDAVIVIIGVISFQLINGTGLIKGLYALVLLFIISFMIDLCGIKKDDKNMVKQIFNIFKKIIR